MSLSFSSRVFLRNSTNLFRNPKRTLTASLSTCCTGQAILTSWLERTPSPATQSRTQRFPRVRDESRRPFSSTPANMVMEDSKRTPWLPLCGNMADLIERNMEIDEFRSWGITMYRTTYKSNTDWAKFLDRFMGSVRTELESYDGVDMLESFRPVVMDDARFDGVTPDQIRDAFAEWARGACETEQGVPYNRAESAFSARYRLCIMVDEEAMQSVLDIPAEDLDKYNTTAFVILINGRWPPLFDAEELAARGLPDNDHEPVYGCTAEEVGWMKVRYEEAQIGVSSRMAQGGDWSMEYQRPPAVCLQF